MGAQPDSIVVVEGPSLSNTVNVNNVIAQDFFFGDPSNDDENDNDDLYGCALCGDARLSLPFCNSRATAYIEAVSATVSSPEILNTN